MCLKLCLNKIKINDMCYDIINQLNKQKDHKIVVCSKYIGVKYVCFCAYRRFFFKNKWYVLWLCDILLSMNVVIFIVQINCNWLQWSNIKAYKDIF
jgi:hypothetical protein